jgi:HEAT repeat protein
MKRRWLLALCGPWIAFPPQVISAPAASLGLRLQSSEGSVRASATVEWENLPRDQKYRQAPLVIKDLIGGLHSRDANTVENAAGGLGVLGALAKEAAPELIDLCGKATDPAPVGDVPNCGPAVEIALARIGPAALPALLALQAHGERPLPLFAIRAISNMKGSAAEMRSGILALGHTTMICEPRATWQALEALKQMKRRSAPAVPALIHLVRDPCPIPEQSLDDNETREMNFTTTHAMAVLAEIGEDAAAAIPVIIDALPIDSDNAVLALASIGRPAIPALIKTLGNTHEVYQEGAARALGRIGPRAIAAIPALQKALEAASPRVRAAAAHAIVAIGPRHPGTLRAVAQHLSDPDPAVRVEAADALHLGAAALAVLPELTRALEDSEPEVRIRAVDAIGTLGEAAHSAIPDVLTLLKDPNEGVRQTAALVIIALGTPDKNSVSRLAAALSDEDPRLRSASADLLGQMGPDAQNALPALKIASQDADPQVQKVAKQAINRIQTPAQTTINLDNDT